MMNRRDALEILGLPVGAPPEAVRRAHRKLMKVWHPDRFARDPELQAEAQRKTQQINGAFDLLKRSAGPEDEAGTPEPPAPDEQDDAPPPQADQEPRLVSQRAPRTRLPAAHPLHTFYLIAGATCAVAALVFLVILATLVLRTLASAS